MEHAGGRRNVSIFGTVVICMLSLLSLCLDSLCIVVHRAVFMYCKLFQWKKLEESLGWPAAESM
jgi:hypothetical protein